MNLSKAHTKGHVELLISVMDLEIGDEFGGKISARVQLFCEFVAVGREHVRGYLHFLGCQRIVVVGVMEVFWVFQVHF